MLKKNKKDNVYRKYLKNLWRGQHLTPARRGLLSEAWARKYDRELRDRGYVIFTRSKAGKKYAEFSDKGVKFLQKYGVLDNELNVLGFL